MNEMWIGGHHFIPGHMSLKDWYIYYKYKLKWWWNKHIGKYKIIDSSKGRFIPYTQDVFVLSEKQTEQVKNGYYKKYIFTPTGIGYVFEVEDLNNNIINLTDYETW